MRTSTAVELGWLPPMDFAEANRNILERIHNAWGSGSPRPFDTPEQRKRASAAWFRYEIAMLAYPQK